MQLENKVAVITGASRGMGEAIARAFAQEGATVVIASRKQEMLDEVMDEIERAGGKGMAIATHTGEQQQCQRLIEQTVGTFGTVDILINNAATNPHFGPILDSEQSHWQKTFDVNVMGYFWTSRYAAEVMQRNGGGKIINMASLAGLYPGPFMGVYSVSKAAVIMMTKVLAQELGRDNIRVNAIAPGIIKTKFAEALWGNPQLNTQYENKNPMGRIGDPQEVVGAALFLASDASSYINGDVLMLDGGHSVNGF
ncbi:MAG: glucose 1-dehydrogenase [Chloroflexi bacterium]|nr:glucose 1-dehydrogenase [Chloroflexota bacterium]